MEALSFFIATAVRMNDRSIFVRFIEIALIIGSSDSFRVFRLTYL